MGNAVLEAWVVYCIINNVYKIVLQKYFVVQDQPTHTERVMQKITAESCYIDGELVPNQGIVTMLTNGFPQELIYQNLDCFGVAFVFSNSDQDNNIAASLTLQEVTKRMLSLDNVISQPEDIYSILDTYIPDF